MTINGRGVTGPGGSVRSASSGTPSQEGTFPLQTTGAPADACVQPKPVGIGASALPGRSPISAGQGKSAASHRIPKWVYRIART